MRKWNQQGHLIGYSQSVLKDDGTAEDGVDSNGIIFNHAYGMLRIEDLTSSQGL